MLNMLIWFAVVLVLFAVGDLIAKLTPCAHLLGVRDAYAVPYPVCDGIIPSDIIDRAGPHLGLELEPAHAALRHGLP